MSLKLSKFWGKPEKYSMICKYVSQTLQIKTIVIEEKISILYSGERAFITSQINRLLRWDDHCHK